MPSASSDSDCDPAFRAVRSPCIGVCTLDAAGLCHGCHRTTHEIARWLQMDDDERAHLMDTVLPARAAWGIDGDRGEPPGSA